MSYEEFAYVHPTLNALSLLTSRSHVNPQPPPVDVKALDALNLTPATKAPTS